MSSLLEKICGFTFDKVYCISIKERKDRQKNVIKECLKVNLNFEFMLVNKNIENPIRGCLESHLKCIKKALESNYDNILILEDDILFNIDGINELIEKNTIQIPKEFDILYLGYHINNGFKFTDNVIKALSTQTTHCYVLNKRIFQYIIDNIEKEWSSIPEYSERNYLEKLINWNCRAIDLFYAKWVNHRRNNSFALYPILGFQYPNYSDIENRMIDYRTIMKEKADKMYSQIFIKNSLDIKKTFMINLDRRQDRWNKMMKILKEKNFDISKITRFSAIDGRTHDFSQDLRLFVNIDLSIIKNPYKSHEFRKGVLGCALSHYKIWKIINCDSNNNNDIFMILEDDIQIVDNFSQKLDKILKILSNDNNWNLTFLGFTDDKDLNSDIMIYEGIKKFSGEKRINGGGTFGYLIRKSGAKKLITIADTDGIRQAIDWFMIEQFDKVCSYKCNPSLVSSLSTFDGNNDSDVQNDISKFESLRSPHTMRIILDDKIFYRDNHRNMFKFNLDCSISYIGKQNSDNRTINTDILLTQDKVKLSLIQIKPSIVLYVGNFSNIMTINLAETISEAFNVFVFCDSPNVKINNVFYLHYSKFQLCIKQIKPAFIICTDLTFFLSNTTNSYKFIFWQQNPFRKNVWNDIPLPVNGRPLLFNIAKLIHKIVCPCDLYKKVFSDTMLIAESSIATIPYCIKVIYESFYSKKVSNKFICLDKNNEKAIEFFKNYKKFHNDSKLILFNIDIPIFDGLEIIKTDSINNIYKNLFSCEYFLNFDYYDEAFYNVLVAIKAKTFCIIHKNFQNNENISNNPWIIIDHKLPSYDNLFSEASREKLLENMEKYIKDFDIKNSTQKWIDEFN